MEIPGLSFASGPAESGYSQAYGGGGMTGDFQIGSRSSNATSQLIVLAVAVGVGVWLWRR